MGTHFLAGGYCFTKSSANTNYPRLGSFGRACDPFHSGWKAFGFGIRSRVARLGCEDRRGIDSPEAQSHGFGPLHLTRWEDDCIRSIRCVPLELGKRRGTEKIRWDWWVWDRTDRIRRRREDVVYCW